jgi:hypothetical protein
MRQKGVMAKKKKKKKNAQAKLPNVQLKLVAKDDTPFYYVNYMSVSHNLSDFTFSVVKLPAEFSPEQLELVKNRQPVVLESTLQLVAPPALAKGLIKALTMQVEKYEERFGKINLPEVEGQK